MTLCVWLCLFGVVVLVVWCFLLGWVTLLMWLLVYLVGRLWWVLLHGLGLLVRVACSASV